MFWLPTMENKGSALSSFPFSLGLLFSSGGNLTSLFVQFSWVHVSNSTQTFAYYLCHFSRHLAHQVFYWFNIYEKVSFRIISPITVWVGCLLYMQTTILESLLLPITMTTLSLPSCILSFIHVSISSSIHIYWLYVIC